MENGEVRMIENYSSEITKNIFRKNSKETLRRIGMYGGSTSLSQASLESLYDEYAESSEKSEVILTIRFYNNDFYSSDLFFFLKAKNLRADFEEISKRLDLEKVFSSPENDFFVLTFEMSQTEFKFINPVDSSHKLVKLLNRQKQSRILKESIEHD